MTTGNAKLSPCQLVGKLVNAWIGGKHEVAHVLLYSRGTVHGADDLLLARQDGTTLWVSPDCVSLWFPPDPETLSSQVIPPHVHRAHIVSFRGKPDSVELECVCGESIVWGQWHGNNNAGWELPDRMIQALDLFLLAHTETR